MIIVARDFTTAKVRHIIYSVSTFATRLLIGPVKYAKYTSTQVRAVLTFLTHVPFVLLQQSESRN